MFEKMMPRRILRPKKDEETAIGENYTNKELHNYYSSPNIVRVIK
jgi:hypothetical protein